MKLSVHVLTAILTLCHQGNVGLLGTDVTVSGILHHPLVEVPDQTSLSETENHENISADGEEYDLFTEMAVSLPPELTGVGRSHLMKIVYNVIGIAGAPANLMVIFIVLKSRRMRDKPFNLLVLHQSFIDFLVCLSMVLNQYYSSLDDVGGPNSSIADLYCRLWISPMTQWTLISCSGNNLVVMTIERYLAITVPLRYDKHKVKKRLPYTFLFIWVLSIVIMCPDIIMSSVSHGQCGVHVFDDKNTGIGIFSFWILTFLIIPTTVMFFSYAHMIIVISNSRFTELNESEKGNMDLSASVKRTKTMKKVQMNVIQTCVIVCMFFVFTMSFSFITDALVIFGWVQDFSSNIWTAAVIAVVLNSCINPFIYTIRYKEFQKELLRLLWISRLCGEEPSNNSMTSNAPTLKKPSNSPPSVY